jgi:hypothetical protein
MKPATYRLIGVHADGKRVIILEPATRELAELVLRLIRHSSPYGELLIEGGPDDSEGQVGHGGADDDEES